MKHDNDSNKNLIYASTPLQEDIYRSSLLLESIAKKHGLSNPSNPAAMKLSKSSPSSTTYILAISLPEGYNVLHKYPKSSIVNHSNRPRIDTENAVIEMMNANPSLSKVHFTDRLGQSITITRDILS